MVFVGVRVRTHNFGSQSCRWIEFFVVQNESESSETGTLAFPSECPKRFEGRITETLQIRTDQGILQDVHVIKSEAAIGLQKRDRASASQGVWILYHESLPKSGLPSLNVPWTSVWFGLHIDHATCDLIQVLSPGIRKELECVAHEEPMAVYHGTSKEAVRSIVKSGLQMTQGMLGHAFYFGFFYKAYRYAVADQDYEWRHGAILRCLVRWNHMCIRVPKSFECACPACKAQKSQGQKISYICDHDGVWAQQGHDAVYVIPWPDVDGYYAMKNEEFATQRPETFLLDSVGFVDGRILQSRNAIDRSVKID